MSKRPRIPQETVTDVLSQSRRRCCLCVFLRDDNSVKKGQIAHLNRIPHDNDIENLVYLCLEHHDEYDSQTSVSKGITQEEVRQYRDRLHAENKSRVAKHPHGKDGLRGAEKPSMLVAEDSEGLAEMIASSFCQSFTVAVARTGREAVAIIDGRPGFDICLVDVVMPPESPGMSLADAMTTGIRIVRRMIDTGKCRRFLVVTVRHDVEATLKATIGDSAHWKVLLKQTSGPEDLRAAVEELMAIKV